MTLFDFDLSEKDMAGADHVMRVGRQLVAAFVRKAREDKITKSELARRLDLDKAGISRMLSGNANLTLRSVGELCWAIGVRPELKLVDEEQPADRSNLAQVKIAPANQPAMLSAHRVRVTAQ